MLFEGNIRVFFGLQISRSRREVLPDLNTQLHVQVLRLFEWKSRICFLVFRKVLISLSRSEIGPLNANDCNVPHCTLFLMIQDSCSNAETPFSMLDFSLHQPKDILERLALPPPNDLETLLQDAAKPAGSSKSTPDQRLGKPITHRANLPPFPWAHTFSGHCKANSDVVKLSSSRSSCQGRWQKIGSTAGSLGDVTDCFKDLESFTYDQSLVPSQVSELDVLENEVGPSASLLQSDWCPSSSTTCSKASLLPPGNTFLKASICEFFPSL